jgi:hypothetical protein
MARFPAVDGGRLRSIGGYDAVIASAAIAALVGGVALILAAWIVPKA